MSETPLEQPQPAGGDTPPAPAPPAQSAPPAPDAPAAAEPAEPSPTLGPEVDVTSPAPPPGAPAPAGEGVASLGGVPLFTLENPFGGAGVGILIGYDPAATHEVGQPATTPATDIAPALEVPKSGGAAHYMDFMTGKGWSVPLNVEAA